MKEEDYTGVSPEKKYIRIENQRSSPKSLINRWSNKQITISQNQKSFHNNRRTVGLTPWLPFNYGDSHVKGRHSSYDEDEDDDDDDDVDDNDFHLIMYFSTSRADADDHSLFSY